MRTALKALFLLLLILSLSLPLGVNYIRAAHAGRYVYGLEDPIGDDDGPGTYKYPTNEVFKEGVFDLTKFKVIYNGTYVIFKVYVRNLGGNPWRGPNGFCLQFPHIFVRTTANMPTNSSTFGLNVALAPNSTWHFALLLAPGWGSEPVPKGERAAIYYSNGTVIAQNDLFKVLAEPEANAIVAIVKATILPDVAHISAWKYVVALAGYDGYGLMRVRGVTPDVRAEWKFGSGDPKAIAVGVEPRVIDLLASTAEAQYRELRSYKVNLEKFTGSKAVLVAIKLNPLTDPLPKLRFEKVKVEVPQALYELASKAKRGEVSISIEMWVSVMPFEEKILRDIIEEFMKEYPGIKVKLVNRPQMKEAFKAAVMVGKGPDLLTWAHDWTGEFVEAGMRRPFDDYLTDSIKSVYLRSALSAATYKGHIWGLPWAAETVALVCNLKMVPKPPKSFGELKEIMEKYYNPTKGSYGISYQVDPYFVSAWVHAFGGFYYNDTTGEVGVGNANTIRGFKFFTDNIAKYMYREDVGHEAQLRLFVEGRTPCIVTGPWDIPKVKEAGIRFSVTPLPAIDPKHVPKPYSGIKLIWMSKLAKERGTDKAAALFALWFTLNSKVISTLTEKAGFVPVNKFVLSMPKIKAIPGVYGYSLAVATSIPMPKSPQMSKVWGPVADAINAVWTGKASVEEAFKLAQEEILRKLGRLSCIAYVGSK